MKQYSCTFEISEQVTEDHWKVTHPSMLATENTTLAEIEEFFRKYHSVSPTELKIIELQ